MGAGAKSEGIQAFRDFSSQLIPGIDGFMGSFFDSKADESEYSYMKEMYGLLKEFCLRKGKRIRPLVFLAALEGYTGGRVAPSDETVALASVLEIMHSLMLIQDDIIDKAELRRGGRALHLILQEKCADYTYNNSIGSDVAIVLTDILFSNAVEIIGGVSLEAEIKNRFLMVFSEMYQITGWGQILDTLYSLPRRVDDRDVPLRISTMKTAYYTLYYPFHLGYVVAGGSDPEEARRIREFALPLGLAFQVRDDILGVYGKSDDTGKPSDTDIIEGKMTFLVQSTLDALEGDEKKAFISLLVERDKEPSSISRVREIMERCHAKRLAMEKLEELVSEAGVRLRELRISGKRKDVFYGIIDLIGKV